jgi:hypothetical protein
MENSNARQYSRLIAPRAAARGCRGAHLRICAFAALTALALRSYYLARGLSIRDWEDGCAAASGGRRRLCIVILLSIYGLARLPYNYTRVRLGIPTAICGRTEETSITDSRLWKIQMLVSI